MSSHFSGPGYSEGFWTWRTMVIPGRLFQSDWHQECSAAAHQHLVLHLLPWHETTPHLEQYSLFPKPSTAGVESCSVPDSILDPGVPAIVLCPLCRRQNKGMCKPFPQSAFSFFQGMFLLCHSRVPWKEVLFLFLVFLSFSVQEWQQYLCSARLLGRRWFSFDENLVKSAPHTHASFLSLQMQMCCLPLQFKDKLLAVEHFQLLPDFNSVLSLWTTLPFHLVFIPLVFPVASDWASWVKKAQGVTEMNPDFWRQHYSTCLAGCCGHITAWQLWTAPAALFPLLL